MDKNEDISRKRDVLAVNGPWWAFLVNEQDEEIPPETNETTTGTTTPSTETATINSTIMTNGTA